MYVVLSVPCNFANISPRKRGLIAYHLPWADPERGDRGSEPPLKIKKNMGFSNTGPDSLNNHKATKPAFNVGPPSAHQRTPFKWRFAGGAMMARF